MANETARLLEKNYRNTMKLVPLNCLVSSNVISKIS